MIGRPATREPRALKVDFVPCPECQEGPCDQVDVCFGPEKEVLKPSKSTGLKESVMNRFERFCLWAALVFMALCATRAMTGCSQLDRAASAFVTDPANAPTTQAASDARIAEVAKEVGTQLPYGNYVLLIAGALATVYLNYRGDKRHAATQAVVKGK